jgi:hypothetical protein
MPPLLSVPPLREPAIYLAPLVLEPAIYLAPMVLEPAIYLAPLVREPAICLSPPLRKPANRLAPPLREPAIHHHRCPRASDLPAAERAAWRSVHRRRLAGATMQQRRPTSLPSIQPVYLSLFPGLTGGLRWPYVSSWRPMSSATTARDSRLASTDDSAAFFALSTWIRV